MVMISLVFYFFKWVGGYDGDLIWRRWWWCHIWWFMVMMIFSLLELDDVDDQDNDGIMRIWWRWICQVSHFFKWKAADRWSHCDKLCKGQHIAYCLASSYFILHFDWHPHQKNTTMMMFNMMATMVGSLGDWWCHLELLMVCILVQSIEFQGERSLDRCVCEWREGERGTWTWRAPTATSSRSRRPRPRCATYTARSGIFSFSILRYFQPLEFAQLGREKPRAVLWKMRPGKPKCRLPGENLL